MDVSLIQHAIYQSDISHGDALEGNCGAIARALKTVFDGKYVVVEDDDGHPRHATVLINGQLFDGTGQTSVETVLSLFTTRDISAIPSDQTVHNCRNLRKCTQISGFARNDTLTNKLVADLQDAIKSE